MSREVIIYGIRAVGTDEIRYVGQTVNLRARQNGQYNAAVTEWLGTTPVEFLELERVAVEDAVEAESRQIERHRLQGCTLLNVLEPCSSRAVFDPLPKRTKSVQGTDLEFAAWSRAAELERRSLQNWIRKTLDEAAGDRFALEQEWSALHAEREELRARFGALLDQAREQAAAIDGALSAAIGEIGGGR